MLGAAIVPCRSEDQAAEVQASVARVLQGEDVGLHVAEGGLRLAERAFRERGNDAFLEVCLARVREHHGVALVARELVVGQAQHVHLDAVRHEGDHRLLMARNARRGVQSDGIPDQFDVAVGDPVAAQEVACRIRTVDLEALGGAAVGGHQAHVVEERADVQQLRVVLQAEPASRQRAEQEHAARVVEQQVGLRVAHQLGRGASQLTVRDGYAGDGLCHGEFLGDNGV